MKPIFTTIFYQTKEKLGLSIIEYCLADIINRLSNTPDYPYCLLPQENIAKNLGISTRQVIRITKKLINLGYLEQEPHIKKFKATQKWINQSDIDTSDKMSHKVTKSQLIHDKMSVEQGDKMSHNNNINNNDNNNIEELFQFFLLKSGFNKILLTPIRKQKIKLRLKTFTPEKIKEAITHAYEHSFYSGDNNRGWKADIDYIFRSDEIIDKLLNLTPQNGESKHIWAEDRIPERKYAFED